MTAAATGKRLFEELFIFDIANNHEGSVELANRTIDAMGEIAERHGINAGFKFQYRDLDTLIHRDFVEREDVKHVPRFLANRLSWDQYRDLGVRVRQRGMKLIVTPFDEASVEWCLKHNVDIIKVASCSADDWPLLTAVAGAGKPVIVSTGGLTIAEIDAVVSFLSHRDVAFALEHCVSIYPTPGSQANLEVMARLAKRYPHVLVGYSGHEGPEDNAVGVVAVSKGAAMLERHVGIPTKEKELNAYSMNPDQTERWVAAVQEARAIGGSGDKRVTLDEAASLKTLKRGVWARRSLKAGDEIREGDVYFAMPLQDGQLTSGQFGRYRTRYVASRDYAAHEPVAEEAQADAISVMRSIVHDAKGILHEAQVQVGGDYEIELSHHHGLEQFRSVGALIVNVINREYCKKLLVVLPGQQHPNHYHRQKEETFHVLWGDLTVNLNGEMVELAVGDQLLVERNTWHSFESRGGAVVEEVSTTHVAGDSYYEDERIAGLDPTERKTLLEEW